MHSIIKATKLGGTKVYVTERYITEKVSEHRTHTVKGNVGGSALAEHAWDSGHDINWDSCKIVDKEYHWKKRKHLESFYICQRQPSLNRGKGTLPSTYSTLFHLNKNQRHL